ncbi:hypothetical protein Bhyg_17900, partial [Pseudolycoriella hygida]
CENPKIQRKQPVDPWKRNEWAALDSQNLRKIKTRNFSLMDFSVVKFEMDLKNAEKSRQKQIRLEMAKRREKLDELDQMLYDLKISLAEKSRKKFLESLSLKEQQFLKIAQQIEINSRFAEDKTKREMEEHRKKTAERINFLKEFENISCYLQLKELFIKLFEKFVRTCISNNQNLKNFAQYLEAKDKLVKEFKGLMSTVAKGSGEP